MYNKKMTKSQQYFQDMLEYNKELFTQFADIHEKFVQDGKKWKEEFDEIGEEILGIIRKYENLLCGHSENGKYGKFSNKTSETFWKLIRGKFPKIDFVGVK